jgi:hypothetical protein
VVLGPAVAVSPSAIWEVVGTSSSSQTLYIYYLYLGRFQQGPLLLLDIRSNTGHFHSSDSAILPYPDSSPLVCLSGKTLAPDERIPWSALGDHGQCSEGMPSDHLSFLKISVDHREGLFSQSSSLSGTVDPPLHI